MESHKEPFWKKQVNSLISSEVSSFAKYFEHFIQFKTLDFDPNHVFGRVKCKRKSLLSVDDSLSQVTDKENQNSRNLIFLNGVFNQDFDIQPILEDLFTDLKRGDRVATLLYNSYFSWIYKLLNFLSLRKGDLPTNFLTRSAINNLAAISGFEVVKIRGIVYFPFKIFGLGSLLNSFLSFFPVIRWFSLCSVIVMRPIKSLDYHPSLSIVIPARNEKGNIENAVKRLDFDKNIKVEILFVEGGSTDGTWEEIQRIIPQYQDKFEIHALKQSKSGKANAVREGFTVAQNELLTILDADLTMPPEKLIRFYNAYKSGVCDFVNGSRLLYPMESEAMRFLNHLGNVFFAKMLSWLLEITIGDSLCGTKLMSRKDYQRFIEWRKDFGDFDPFGDFELIFPAAILGLGVKDIPIKYAARTYGETNISRFTHGLVLLKMTLVGFFKVRLAKFPD